MRKFAAISGILLFLGFVSSTPAADFNGDGRDEIAIFRPTNGLWAVRGLSRVYFGQWRDYPVIR